MKQLFFSTLAASSAVTALIPTNRWRERGTLVDTDPLVRPFLTYTVTNIQRTGHGSGISTLELFVYDDRDTYDRIHDFLRTVRTYLEGISEQRRVRADGTVVLLTQCVWNGQGPELNDEVYQANLVTANWQLIGSGQ